MLTLWILATLLGAIVVITIASLISRRADRALTLPRGVFVANLVAAAIVAVVTVIETVTTIVGTTVDVALPVRTYWPQESLGGTADVVDGGFRTADVSVQGLDATARLWLAAGTLAQGVTLVIVLVAVAIVARRVVQGDPFRPLVARTLVVTGVALAVGSVVWQVSLGLGGHLAAVQVLQPGGPSGPEVATGLQFELFSVGAGLAIAAIALIIRRGEALQRDTEGLV